MSARYEVEGVAGRGAMSVVYRARQVGTGGRLVAYKRVAATDPALLARLRREAEILAELDHPNIVRIFDVVEEDDGLAIVMQYASGGTLADVLAARGPLPPDLAVGLVATIADALASAHRCGVLHRDVKPANILFTRDGHPLLSDFGVARRSGTAPLTDASGIGPATAEYLDPAVAAGAGYGERSDCYALGVVAYETLTGRRPFGGVTPLAVLRAADAGAAAPLRSVAPDVPPAVEAVVDAAMARDPGDRPAGAAELAGALREALANPDSAPDPSAPPDVSRVRPDGAFGAPDPSAPRRTDPPTRVFGPRPPQRPAPSPARAVSRRLVAVAAAVLLMVPPAVAAGVVLSRRASAPVAPAAAPPPAAVSVHRQAAPVCRGVDVPVAAAGAAVLTGDLDGTGCRSWVRFRDGLLEVGRGGAPVRYRLGTPGDQLVLGDWDCDGSDTAALYRPVTGELFTFTRWAAADAAATSASAQLTGVKLGTARVIRDGRCDRVEVDPPAPDSV